MSLSKLMNLSTKLSHSVGRKEGEEGGGGGGGGGREEVNQEGLFKQSSIISACLSLHP
jgi:hypothetical protein